VAPPLKLKHHGLGDGTLDPWVLVASLPYALLVACVLLGKHVDKLEADAAKGIHTLPVILGRERSLFLTQELMVGFFIMVPCLVLVGTFGLWTLLVFLALPHLWTTLRVYNHPRPERPPRGFPIWPLWYVAWAFRVTRSAGALLVVGLILDAIWPARL
jgi:1,4-dihydroxy-2-naphthoate octaprenyltransferase